MRCDSKSKKYDILYEVEMTFSSSGVQLRYRQAFLGPDQEPDDITLEPDDITLEFDVIIAFVFVPCDKIQPGNDEISKMVVVIEDAINADRFPETRVPLVRALVEKLRIYQ